MAKATRSSLVTTATSPSSTMCWSGNSRGTAMYGLSWFDAHLWAYAEVYGVEEILSEDFAHGRHYGTVRAVNPFLSIDGVHELPPLYTPTHEEETSPGRSRSTAAHRRHSYSRTGGAERT